MMTFKHFLLAAAFLSFAAEASAANLYVGFNTPFDNNIGIYPLVPNAFGTTFANATNPQDLTIAGGKLYWIDGDSVLDANLDGTGLSTLQTFGVAPTSIEVYDPPASLPPATPEPSTLALFSIAIAAILATKRRVLPR